MEKYELGDPEHVQSVYLLYCDGMAEKRRINDFIIPQLASLINDKQSMELDKKIDLTRVKKDDELVHRVFCGELVIYFDRLNVVYSIDISDPPQRLPTESNTEISIKGSKDAFIDSQAASQQFLMLRTIYDGQTKPNQGRFTLY